MRVLWFTNTPSCYSMDNVNPYNGGGWIASAEKAIRQVPGIDLAVSFLMNGQEFKHVQNGVTYYPISYYSQSISNKIFKHFSLLSERFAINYEEKSWDYYLAHFKQIIDDFAPDIIHVWGSEGYFGLVNKVTDIPVVLHIQGVLNPYKNAFLPPFVSWCNYSSGILNKMKVFFTQRGWEMNCHRERVIHQGIFHYLGRTDWDMRVSHIMNVKSHYYHVDEILRESFYDETQRTIPRNLTIITTISSPLYKGFDLVLKTAKILKENLLLDFEWNCYGNINHSFIEKVVGIKHEDVNVHLRGVASSSELAESELKSTLYFHPSYIDNSPNSLCEAQMLALPVISTNVGGISSIVKDGETGFLVPSNDPYQSAYLIEKLYLDRDLNITMGECAKKMARERHDQYRVIQQILNVYEILKNK